MLTLTFPKPSTQVYPHGNFGRLANLICQTEINLKTAKDYLLRGSAALENEHILVGLVQQLGIDPNWDLETVVLYTRLRANMLASTFKITNVNRLGDSLSNGVYRENTREMWVLIENEYPVKHFEKLTLETLRPVIPFYSTKIKRGYKPNYTRDTQVSNPPKDLAIIGIDLVELAVGWWLYMNNTQYDETGIHTYCSKFPLFTAQMIHNELAVTNILYEFVVKGFPLDDLFETDVVQFASINENKLLKDYFIYNVNWVTDRTLLGLEHLISQFKPIYREHYSNVVSRGISGCLTQTVWAWEPMVLKWLAIYLTIANQMKYRAHDYNQEIARCLPTMKKRYQKIKDKHFMDHFTALADEIFLLNEINMN